MCHVCTICIFRIVVSFFVYVYVPRPWCCAAGSYMTSFLIIALFDRLNSDRCEIIVWGRQNNNKISTFFCVGRRMEIYRFIVWKNHVCPSGSLRVKYEDKEKGKKRESDAASEREGGEGETARERERRTKPTINPR